jgi:hypothetical protein
MRWTIENEKLARARTIVLQRFDINDVEMVIDDFSITNPKILNDRGFESWLHGTFNRINLKQELCLLIEKLADKMGGEEDADAAELRKIVNDSRPPSPPDSRQSPQSAEPESTPTPPRPARLNRIVLLGESTAISAKPVREAREVLREELTAAFKGTPISISDWGDSWKAEDARTPESEDTRALFVRVINTDVLNDNLPSLTSLPKKLGEKLKLQGRLDASQIVIWNCMGAGPDAGSNDREQDPDDPRVQLAAAKLPLAEHKISDLVKIVRSRLRLEKWPPVLRLEDPGNNKLIQKKLIDVILSSTREKCDPPYPQVLYLWGTSGPKAGSVMAEPKDLISDDASQDGLIIAIHDLNLTMTDNDKQAFWEFQQRLAQYDKLLTPIIKAKNIPDSKVIKLAIIMERSLPDDQFPYSYMLGDWTIAGMKKEKDGASLKSEDETRIKEKIDALLGVD